MERPEAEHAALQCAVLPYLQWIMIHTSHLWTELLWENLSIFA